jgi:hypothetical protein
MEMFKGDMTVPDLYGSLINISIRKHPLRLTLNELFLDTNVENLFNSSSMFNENTVAMFNFNGVSSYIEESSNIKNNMDDLVSIFPQIDEAVGEMDMAARYGEEELQESESTPDVRLHYPEPFIASPSFVHEEIWFIHILHYQH